ncbi:MAG: D-alanine--D-alanine ligase family protein [Acidobacteriota bacterium]|nr:D-alanine--D-alanine ligase family protein [Acidobacteriota bacterium]
MTRVALIFGGQSPEHEVSIVSARYVYSQLREAGYSVLPVGIDRSGGWHFGGHAFETLCQNPVPKGEGLTSLAAMDVDVVFPIIHGLTGEDGSIQGYCNLLGLPWVGSDVLSASLCWDKLAARAVLLEHGIPQPPYLALYRENYDPDVTATQVAEQLGFPVFVKPARAGSSIGISKVNQPENLAAALENAFRFDYRVLVEPGLEAREIEIAGLGAQDPQLSIPARIIPENEFYDFEEKYLNGRTTFEVPARIEPHVLERMHDIARRAWLALNCYGMARIDFLVTDDEVFLNEINTHPGFTSISMYPRLMRESGVPTPELMRRLVQLALDRDRLQAVTRDFQSGRDWFKG